MKRSAGFYVLTAAFFVWVLIPVASHGFKQADVDKLLSTKECQWCDLNGANLEGADLAGANLASANLSSANLAKANLAGANLAGSYFRKANLKGANLTNAFMQKANLSRADLSGVNTTGTDFTGATGVDGTKCIEDSIGECKREVLFHSQ